VIKKIIKGLSIIFVVSVLGKMFFKEKEKNKKLDFEASKKQYYVNVLSRWIRLSLDGRTIGKYLSQKGLLKVAVYGWGDLGKCICDDICNTSNVEIMYIVDRNADKIADCKYSVVSQVNKIEDNVDLLIVTPFMEFEQIKRNMIKDGFTSEIVSLEDIVYDL
jgi:FlaA1/EpsC-like NDP-sugar epimerase